MRNATVDVSRRIFSLPLASLLLALFLLAQAGALWHEFSHVGQDEGDAPDAVCALCLAAATLGSAAPLPALPPFALPLLGLALCGFVVILHFSTPCRAYRERAPPIRR
jgi:hypothetical protein